MWAITLDQTPNIFKLGDGDIWILLANTFNLFLGSVIPFPQLKTSIIIPIHSKGTWLDSANYRLINHALAAPESAERVRVRNRSRHIVCMTNSSSSLTAVFPERNLALPAWFFAKTQSQRLLSPLTNPYSYLRPYLAETEAHEVGLRFH